MMNSLSKSIAIMFLFDFAILYCFSFLIGNLCNFSFELNVLSSCLITIAGLIILFLKGNYKIREFNITIWNCYRLFEGVVFTIIPVWVLLSFILDRNILIEYLLLNTVLIFSALYLYRICFHYYLFNIKKVKKVIIIGNNERTKTVIDVIKNKKALKMEIEGVFDNTPEISDIEKADIIIWSNKSHLLPVVPQRIKMYLMPDFYELATGRFYIDEDTVEDFAYDVYKKYSNSMYDTLKRRLDIISALIILIVTLPITAYIALRVWFTDKSSPFFSQIRVGKNGKRFECYKLRTMYVNDYVPKSSNDVKYAKSIKTDDRIIPFCRWVRKARFDELPQMINIIKGDMSIVGPRAEWADEAKVFEKNVPYYNLRQMINAGWTGWSHINMNPVFSIEEEKERLSYDLYYIKYRNILWDLAILIKAVFLACGGRHK